MTPFDTAIAQARAALRSATRYNELAKAASDSAAYYNAEGMRLNALAQQSLDEARAFEAVARRIKEKNHDSEQTA